MNSSLRSVALDDLLERRKARERRVHDCRRDARCERCGSEVLQPGIERPLLGVSDGKERSCSHAGRNQRQCHGLQCPTVSEYLNLDLICFS